MIIEPGDDNAVNSLELIESLSLVHPKLIDHTLKDQPIDIPTFANDYTLSCYLNAVEHMNSSTSEQSVNLTEPNVEYLSLKNQKKRKISVLMAKTTLWWCQNLK